jgi:rhodanese-related sulfurtransferase
MATTVLSNDYNERAQLYQFATKDTIQKILSEHDSSTATATTDNNNDNNNNHHNHPTVVVLDVRTVSEVEGSGWYHPPHTNHYIIPCTPHDASNVQNQASLLFPSQKDTPIVVYCASGRRACTAVQVLREVLGYQTVLNAGGYADIVAMGLEGCTSKKEEEE